MGIRYIPTKRRELRNKERENTKKRGTGIKTELEESFNTLKNLKNEINLIFSLCGWDRKKETIYSEDLFNKLTTLKQTLYSMDGKFKKVTGFVVMKRFFDDIFEKYSLSCQETIDGINHKVACIPKDYTRFLIYPETRDIAYDMKREEKRSIRALWIYASNIMEPLELYLGVLESDIS